MNSRCQFPWLMQIAGVTNSYSGTLLVTLLLLVVSHLCAVAEVSRDPKLPICRPGSCSLIAHVRGEIDKATVDELMRLDNETRLQASTKKMPVTKAIIYLDSPGGSVSAAVALGRHFRSQRFLAVVPADAKCLSACVLVLAGATNRGIYPDAKVGIHRPYLEVPQQQISRDAISALYQRMLQDIRSYFREMNVSEQLADAMLRVEPENMRLLNKTELESYGLTQRDPIDREVEELKAAQQLGVSRIEYMRRMNLIDRACGPLPLLEGAQFEQWNAS